MHSLEVIVKRNAEAAGRELGTVQEWWTDDSAGRNTQHGAVCHAVVTRRDENDAALAWKWVRE